MYSSPLRNSLLTISRLKGIPGDWKRILEQKGMFSILGLSLEKVLELRST